ncbi:MAG: TIGR03790 family protein, partial [Spartobacteria bacterium]
MSRLAICFLILLSASVLNAQDRLAAATLVLFNSNDPDSVELAGYYAAAREIPSDQVLGFEMPTTEEISRADFNRLLADPLKQRLVEKGWWTLKQNGEEGVADTRIRFVAIIRGVPLKISADASIAPASEDSQLPKAIGNRNEASVDSELAALGLPDYKTAGVVPNPYFGRFTPILDEAMPAGLLLPSRLDAPTPEMVRAMIDDAIATEKEGLWGWAYVDGRDITSGGYFEGDNWMRNLVKILRERGVPTIYDNLPVTFSENFPITDAAVYFGWYTGNINGPFLRENFRFRRGAVAVHLHSFSAASLRGMESHWSAPLIARGAAATLGNVYEPYLSFTANLDVFQDRLMAGLTLAESGWMSQRALSWMGIV